MTGVVPAGPARPPAAGVARRLVMLLHGLGADGNDLIGLADVLAPHLPDAAFVAPDAPFPCDMAPAGRQWFSLGDAAPESLPGRVGAAAGLLDACIDAQLRAHGLAAADLALVGFSQGAMMALHAGLRRPGPCAAICGFSGMLVGPETLAREIAARPPVLLVHGDADPVVPFGAMAAAAAALSAAGVPVETLARPGLAHGIDGPGLDACRRHLARAFGGAGGAS